MLVDDFADLFEGRKDAYGTEYGGAMRPDETHHIERGYRDFIARHLAGSEPIGVYPLVPLVPVVTAEGHSQEWCVKWGCVDFDIKSDGHKLSDYATEDEAHEAALNLVDVLASFGVTGWIERTRSGGRHVWVFADRWTVASTMRRALLVACEIAGTASREVNPKSEGEGEPPEYLGNYVRLPYPGGENATERRMFSPQATSETISIGPFLRRALISRAKPYELGEIARLWTPPQRIITPRDKGYELYDTELSRDISTKLGGLAYTILNEGPLEDGDRSTTLMRLAHLCREDGLTPDEAYAVVTAADMSWGKFHARRDGERRLEQMIESAFADWEYV